MARTHGRILTSIWIDDDFKILPLAPQFLYLALVTSPRLSYCGVLDYLPARLARLTPDLTGPRVLRAVADLETARFLIIDRDTSELLVRSFIRHDGLLAQPNLTKAMAKAYRLIESDCVRAAVLVELRRIYRSNSTLPGWGEKGLKEADPDLFGEVSSEPIAEPFGEPFEEGIA